jgi:hypothetical protein
MKETTVIRRVNLAMTVALIQRVEEWRRTQPGLPNMSEAIRQLVTQALDAPRKTSKSMK